MMKLFFLLVAGALMTRVDGFIFSRSSSSSVNQQTSHFSTNNCHCNNFSGNIMDLLKKYFGGSIGKREAAAVLDVDEDYPGLNELMDHVGMKRDGTVDSMDFIRAVRNAASQSSQSNNPNLCHCGRMVVDQFHDLL